MAVKTKLPKIPKATAFPALRYASRCQTGAVDQLVLPETSANTTTPNTPTKIGTHLLNRSLGIGKNVKIKEGTHIIAIDSLDQRPVPQDSNSGPQAK
jgi:hypothetical protein